MMPIIIENSFEILVLSIFGSFVRHINNPKKMKHDTICRIPWLIHSGKVAVRWPINVSSIIPVAIATEDEISAKSIVHQLLAKKSSIL